MAVQTVQDREMSAVETRKDVRFVGRLPGRYVLPKHVRQRGRRTLACQTQGLTPRNMTLTAPIVGAVGEPVSANIEEIGLVHGYVARTVEGGFNVDIDVERNDVDQLARRIAWVKKHLVNGKADERAHPRVLPRNPHSTLVLADGTVTSCFIVDMSASGAAIYAEYQPPVGTPLAIGKVVGRVVRTLEVGFAVKFLETQVLSELESLISRRPEQLA